MVQTRQADVVHAASAVGGLPAEASSCSQALQLQPARDDQERGTDRRSFPGHHVAAAAAKLVGNRIKIQPHFESSIVAMKFSRLYDLTLLMCSLE